MDQKIRGNCTAVKMVCKGKLSELGISSLRKKRGERAALFPGSLATEREG